MTDIIIKTQSEMDALPASFSTFTRIIIQNDPTQGRIIVRMARDNSSVVAWENSSVVARENSSVVAYGNSSVVAGGNSSVVARDNSSVEAHESSSVVAQDNSSVLALGNSSVQAYGNSSVVALGNSSVVAWENPSVVAYGNSSVEAWGNSSVQAFDTVRVSVQSLSSKVELFGFSSCYLMVRDAKASKKSVNATIIKPRRLAGNDGWLQDESVKKDHGNVDLVQAGISRFQDPRGHFR